MLKLGKVMTVLALVMVLGLHWTLLQGVAWVSMLIRYSQQNSFSVAVVQTFDGQHPCSICVFILEGKQAEKKSQQPQLTTAKIEVFLDSPQQFIFADTGRNFPAPGDDIVHPRAEWPPHPPPRFA